MSNSPFRLVLADDHLLFLESFSERLRREPDLEVVAAVRDSWDVLRVVQQLRPDLLVLDVDLQGQGSFLVTREVKARYPDTRIVFLSGFVVDVFVDQALRLQADGFLDKTQSTGEVIDGLRRVVAGDRVFSPSVAERLQYDSRQRQMETKSSHCLSTLTSRQLTVLRHLARGESVKQVAQAMVRSERSIESHKYRIMQQLGIHDRVELARFAIREGLCMP